jgi:hypothetical protein
VEVPVFVLAKGRAATVYRRHCTVRSTRFSREQRSCRHSQAFHRDVLFSLFFLKAIIISYHFKLHHAADEASTPTATCIRHVTNPSVRPNSGPIGASELSVDETTANALVCQIGRKIDKEEQ